MKKVTFCIFLMCAVCITEVVCSTHKTSLKDQNEEMERNMGAENQRTISQAIMGGVPSQSEIPHEGYDVDALGKEQKHLCEQKRRLEDERSQLSKKSEEDKFEFESACDEIAKKLQKCVKVRYRLEEMEKKDRIKERWEMSRGAEKNSYAEQEEIKNSFKSIIRAMQKEENRVQACYEENAEMQPQLKNNFSSWMALLDDYKKGLGELISRAEQEFEELPIQKVPLKKDGLFTIEEKKGWGWRSELEERFQTMHTESKKLKEKRMEGYSRNIEEEYQILKMELKKKRKERRENFEQCQKNILKKEGEIMEVEEKIKDIEKEIENQVKQERDFVVSKRKKEVEERKD